MILIIQSLLSTEVRERLINGDVKEEEDSSKVFYDTIIRIVLAALENAI